MVRIDVGKLSATMAGLPQPERDVFRLSAVEHLDYAAIAERLGITVSEVEAKLADALVRLDQLLHGDR